MLFQNPTERSLASALVQVGNANPFHQDQRKALEQAALAMPLPDEVKHAAVPSQAVIERPNLPPLLQRGEALAGLALERLRDGCRVSPSDRTLYRDLVLLLVYFRFRERLQNSVEEMLAPTEPTSAVGNSASRTRGLLIPYFDQYARDITQFLGPVSGPHPEETPERWFASGFQIRRAFHLIHAKILGKSEPVARLRAAVWQSIFTHDMPRWNQSLRERMHDITTLITGPSGTGKDLVAEAIGLSRQMRFDPATKRFEEDISGAFHPVNLSALSPELIESELFGHCKGAFTGAVHERIGWLELCGRSHTVFLDEIGELAPSIQVKLLRVLQNREFQRVGETKPRRFEGKVIAATNRDLDLEMQEGRFRRDFYYRLCSDLIRTPTLHERISADPEELPFLADIITRRLYGEVGAELTEEVVGWIDRHLGRDYPWPGNIRELEQCIRNILVRQEYHPARAKAPGPDDFTARFQGLQLTADELLNEYCTRVYAQTGSYAATAQRLQVDRRTVKGRIDKHVLERLRMAN